MACVLIVSEEIVYVHSAVMDDDSCVLKYIEVVPLENNAEQFEDLKTFQVKVCIIAKVVYQLVIMKCKVKALCTTWQTLLNASVSKV